MLIHFFFVLRTIIDKGIKKNKAIFVELYEEEVAFADSSYLSQVVAIIFNYTHDLLLEIDVAENDLSLKIYARLQTN